MPNPATPTPTTTSTMPTTANTTPSTVKSTPTRPSNAPTRPSNVPTHASNVPARASNVPTCASAAPTCASRPGPQGGTRRLGRVAAAPLAAAALAVAGLPLAAAAEAEPSERKSRAGAGCLWAGTTHPQDSTVVASGTSFRCGAQSGAPYWFAGAATDRPSTVPTPGATASPVGKFSAGARQPGTSYTDYCVGNQLIPGTDDVYQVVRLPGDVMLWKAAHPISQWDFDSARPAPTWRTASLCIDGVLT
ncbi:hypothetical protein ACFXPS_39375 [Nocardia sp. NPDC059091]|uniref:hypothetical protein n=1 Tax=Nocardia sp. NPDC059091 TaxID=3346724 RepID=UPI00367E13B4